MATNPYESPSQPTSTSIACPHCRKPTDSLKQYEVIESCVFVLIMAQIQPQIYLACPDCMRGILWRRCLMNIVPANLLWLPYIVPRTIIQHLATYVGGMSPAIRDAIRQYERESADQ
jgi:hypothetical protein